MDKYVIKKRKTDNVSIQSKFILIQYCVGSVYCNLLKK